MPILGNNTILTVALSRGRRSDRLGFIVTKSLNLDKHCEVIANKAMVMVSRLFRALSTKRPEVLIQAYKSYTRLLLEYGTPVFSPYKRSVIEKLEKVQNSLAGKLVIGIKGAHLTANDVTNLTN